jgi:hypothetical protein
MTMAPVTTTIPSQRYAVGEHVYGPWALAQNTETSVDIQPDSDLPAGVTLDFFMEHSTDGGATWVQDTSATNVPGPQLAANLEESVGIEVRVPNWQERLRLVIKGAAWRTGFTVTVSSGPLPG